MKYVMLALFLISYLFWFIPLCQALYFGRRSRSWPRTKGRVVKSELVKARDANALSAMRYRAILRYEFMIKERTYTSNVISFGDAVINRLNSQLRSKGVAQRIVQRYPVDRVVVVYYDPQNPRLATLRRGVASTNFLIIMTASLVMPIMLMIALF